MNKLASIFVAMAAVLCSPANLLFAAPAFVSEHALSPTSVEYTLGNTSNTTPNPFDITVLVVHTTGTNPTTTNPNWIARHLTEDIWENDPMFGDPHDPLTPTWHEFTGKSWAEVNPLAPIDPCNGYFLQFNQVGTQIDYIGAPIDPCFPGEVLSGFFFEGVPSSTFFVAGPADSSQPFTVGNVLTFTGQAVPEPSSLSLCIVVGVCGVAAACLRRMRRT